MVHYAHELVVRVSQNGKKNLPPVPKVARTELANAKYEPTRVQRKAAELYGRGMTANQIANVLRDHVVGRRRDKRLQLQLARKKVRQWTSSQWFRDLAWEAAVTQADQATGDILRGLTRNAKRGRVDAAKMVMGVAGRYEEKGFGQAAQVNVVIEGVPRPASRPAIESQVVAEEWADES
jgi:hypothetical protein